MKPKLTKPIEVTAEALPHDPVVTTTSILSERDELLEKEGFEPISEEEQKRKLMRHQND